MLQPHAVLRSVLERGTAKFHRRLHWQRRILGSRCRLKVMYQSVIIELVCWLLFVCDVQTSSAGYTNMPGFLAPFRDERYDLPKFHSGKAVDGREELFNLRHSSLRTTIEWTFGVFKKRFPIFREMPHSRQGPILIACCAIHNWIRIHSEQDKGFLNAEFD